MKHLPSIYRLSIRLLILFAGIGLLYGDIVCAGAKPISDLVNRAEEGSVDAQIQLGIAYRNGEDVSKNPKRALFWFRKAVKQDSGVGKRLLGEMYENGNGVKRNFRKAARWYQKAADSGDLEALVNLGMLYETGQGVTRDFREAVKLYQKAADHGFGDGRSHLWKMFERGLGVDRDFQMTADLSERILEQVHTRGQTFLGLMYERGVLGAARDMEEVEQWDKHNVFSGRKRGRMIAELTRKVSESREIPVEAPRFRKNRSKEILEWYEKAAREGNVNAQDTLATIYAAGKSVEKDDQKAFYWFNKAAENGNAYSQAKLAERYYLGAGVTMDRKKAFHWCQKAAEQGYGPAQYSLALKYYQGDGIKQDVRTAFDWFKKAAKQGISGAQAKVGLMYYTGEGALEIEPDIYFVDPASDVFDVTVDMAEIAEADEDEYLLHAALNVDNAFVATEPDLSGGPKKDLDLAVYWFQKAAEQGDVVAQERLGRMLFVGQGVEKDIEKAAYWVQKAAEQGYHRARNILDIVNKQIGKKREESRRAEDAATGRDLKQEIEWYEKEAEYGNIDAQFFLGQKYSVGVEVEQDLERAFYWFLKAAERDNVEARQIVAQMYIKGEGVGRDPEEAAYWFEKVAKTDNIDARNTLARMYAEGEGVEKDPEEAAYWYRKAAEQGSSVAQYSLGFMYLEGQGVEQDLVEAVYWLEMAGEQGSVDAQNLLGLMYTDGRGVKKDFDMAVFWFQKAARQGVNDPEKYVTLLRKEFPDAAGDLVFEIDLDDEKKDVGKETYQASDYYKFGEDYAKAGSYDQAIEQYLKAIEIDSTDPAFYQRLAFAYMQNGNVVPAEESIGSALKLRPGDASLHGSLGLICQAGGKFDDAVLHYKEALKRNPGYSGVYYNMAAILIDQGDYEQAWKCANLAQALGHPGEEILDLLESESEPEDQLLAPDWKEKWRGPFYIRNIVVSSSGKAEKVLRRLRDGEDFNFLAAEFAGKGYDGNSGYLGLLVKERFAPEIYRALKDLRPFDFSPVLEDEKGFHVFQKIIVFDELLNP
ncbi:MAG: tetratricopeptide repeat protein [Thermodesulfobacteriota bacterium]|nr:tetratricopeptide repeat protein [Thermodesulfobacteriota bacterium]